MSKQILYHLPFNKETEMELYMWLRARGGDNVSKYLKTLIWEDMHKTLVEGNKRAKTKKL